MVLREWTETGTGRTCQVQIQAIAWPQPHVAHLIIRLIPEE
ncbi:hypothetical protein [Sulfobacillus thermosulfidooxidans]|nr:hypothetical protein [Sulfobacillus thermosulfidooxidans]